MKVMEVYKAFQGEGQRIGSLSTVVRLFGCNLRCSWCDTAYSINRKEWEALELDTEPYTELTPVEVVDLCKTTDVVITGGEPLLQKPEVVELIEIFIRKWHFTTVETNGTILPPESLVNRKAILWSVSPKLERDNDMEILKALSELRHVQFKFVLSSVFQIDQVLDLLSEMKFVSGYNNVILQPNGELYWGPEGNLDRYLRLMRLLEIKLKTLKSVGSIRVLPQLHLLLHGRKRFR